LTKMYLRKVEYSIILKGSSHKVVGFYN